MKLETTNSDIKLIEKDAKKGLWYIRWNIKKIIDDNGNDTYTYEEEAFSYPVTIVDVKNVITEWYNKQTNMSILHGFNWKDRQVYLSDENKFNYKAIIDEAARIETSIAIWDKEHPELAGKNHVIENDIEVPTGRPYTLLPITLKLGRDNSSNSFYVFETIGELQEFFSAGVQYLIGAYGQGWYKIATFDYAPYIEILNSLK